MKQNYRYYPESVKINTPEGAQEIKNDFVLAMTGYQPDFSLLESWEWLP